jgi:hypothetical protein
MSAEWTEYAVDRLADIYTAADPADRDGIATGGERITAQLAADPWTIGESRSRGQRVWSAHRRMVAY